jgi:hypothetical protein
MAKTKPESAFDTAPPPPPDGEKAPGGTPKGDGSPSHTPLIAAGGGVGAIIAGGALWSWSPLATAVGMGVAGTGVAGGVVAARRRKARGAVPGAKSSDRAVRSAVRAGRRAVRLSTRGSRRSLLGGGKGVLGGGRSGRGPGLGGALSGKKATGPVRSKRADRGAAKAAAKPAPKSTIKPGGGPAAGKRSLRDRLTGRTRATGPGPGTKRPAKTSPAAGRKRTPRTAAKQPGAPKSTGRVSRAAAALGHRGASAGRRVKAAAGKPGGRRASGASGGGSRRPAKGAPKLRPASSTPGSAAGKGGSGRSRKVKPGASSAAATGQRPKRRWWTRAAPAVATPPKPAKSKGANSGGTKTTPAVKPLVQKPVAGTSAKPQKSLLGAKKLPATQPQFGLSPARTGQPVKRAPANLTPLFSHPGGDMSTDASTGHTRSRTYEDGATEARRSALKLDDHAATARGEASRLEGMAGMEDARDTLLDEARRADATAEDRRALGKGFAALAPLEGRD